MIGRVNLSRITSDFGDIVEHRPVLFIDWRRAIVVFQRSHQFFIQGDSTQKLCVRFDSVMTVIQH